MGSCEETSIKTAVPNVGSSVVFQFSKGLFEGFGLANDCMQAFTSVSNMPASEPSPTSDFLLDQGSSEASVRRAHIARKFSPESITDRELLSAFGTHAPGASYRMLCNWLLPEPLF